MKRVLAATFVGLFISSFAFAQKSDEQMILDRAQEFADAWNKHDATAMAYLWAADGDLINPMGRKASGLTEIQRLLADEQSKAMKSSTYAITGMKVRFLNPQMAIVDQDVEVTGVTAPDGTTMTLKPHATAVVTKSGGQWWLASVRAFTFVPPPPPPPAK
jgi:uncharacterized protein (TIGR02246 family)